jgi:hypothetical protein
VKFFQGQKAADGDYNGSQTEEPGNEIYFGFKGHSPPLTEYSQKFCIINTKKFFETQIIRQKTKNSLKSLDSKPLQLFPSSLNQEKTVKFLDFYSKITFGREKILNILLAQITKLKSINKTLKILIKTLKNIYILVFNNLTIFNKLKDVIFVLLG